MLYGGALGGGKTYYILIKAFQHYRTLIIRQSYPQLKTIRDMLHRAMLETGGQSREDRTEFITNDGRLIHCRYFGHESDKDNFQGQPYDLIAIDECTQISWEFIVWISMWNRRHTGVPKDVFCEIIMTCNPPENQEGAWVKREFKSWLDKKNPDRLKSGEIGWFAYLNGRLTRVKDSTPIEIEEGGKLVTIYPESRCYVRSTMLDNAFLGEEYYRGLDYLRAFPERYKAMIEGDFDAYERDDFNQLYPTDWLNSAVERGRTMKAGKPVSTGADVARGGKDESVLAFNDGHLVHGLSIIAAEHTDTGWKYIGWAKAEYEKRGVTGFDSILCIDATGVGNSPYDIAVADPFFADSVIGLIVGESVDFRTSKSGIGFANLKAALYYHLRERLDPESESPIGLPDDDLLIEQLRAIRFEFPETRTVIAIEKKEKYIERMQYSPDRAEAVIYSFASQLLGGYSLSGLFGYSK